jgi:NTE family protein
VFTDHRIQNKRLPTEDMEIKQNKKPGTGEKSSPRFGIAFSSGFFGFFAHAGFLAGIRENGIIPSAYTGASSGAIVAAMAASGMDDGEVKEMVFGVKKEDFWDPDPWHTVFSCVIRLFRGYTGYLRGNSFGSLLNKLPIKRIEDCTVPLGIAATDLTRKKGVVFTSGNLAKAVQASGSVPMLFKPVSINGSLYSDGGVIGKAPVRALADLSELDLIIVHYVSSGNLKNASDSFLQKNFTPWHIQHLAVNIARREAYQRELEMVRNKGVKVIEVNSRAPVVGPNTLFKGVDAYEKAKAEGLKLRANLDS